MESVQNNNPATGSVLSTFWCHTCRIEFKSSSTDPSVVVQCPQCRGDFCEEINVNNPEMHPKDFKPYNAAQSQSQNQQQGPVTHILNPQQSPVTHILNTPPVVHNIAGQQMFSMQPNMFGNHLGLMNNITSLINQPFANGTFTFSTITNGPLPPQLNLFGMQNMIPGFGGVQDGNLDQIIHNLMQNDPNTYGPPPASKQILDNLPVIKITKEYLEKEGAQECSVCKEEFKEDEDAYEITCKHKFHKDCILPWLTKHNSCPSCRFELPTDDIDYENRKLQRVLQRSLAESQNANQPNGTQPNGTQPNGTQPNGVQPNNTNTSMNGSTNTNTTTNTNTNTSANTANPSSTPNNTTDRPTRYFPGFS